MKNSIIHIVMLSAAMFMAMTACDNTLEPFDRVTEEFSIYGKLDLKADSNFIRVKDLNTPLLTETTRNFDAEVVLQNITAGTQEILDFKRIRFQDIYVFNFFTTQAIEEATEYRLSVRRNGEEISGSSTTTPALTTVTYQRASQRRFCVNAIDIRIEPVAEGELVVAGLEIIYDGNPYAVRVLLGTQRRSDGIIEFSFIPQEILNQISESPSFTGGRITCGDLSDQNFYLNYTHLSEDYPDKRLELDVPLPGVFQNLIGVYDQELVIPINN